MNWLLKEEQKFASQKTRTKTRHPHEEKCVFKNRSEYWEFVGGSHVKGQQAPDYVRLAM